MVGSAKPYGYIGIGKPEKANALPAKGTIKPQWERDMLTSGAQIKICKNSNKSIIKLLL